MSNADYLIQVIVKEYDVPVQIARLIVEKIDMLVSGYKDAYEFGLIKGKGYQNNGDA